MKKKIIGSSILLVVLLLGLSTICFADEITEENIKNFVYNASVSFGAPVDDSVFERQNYINWYNAISNVINSKDFFIYASWGTQSGGTNVNLEITLQTFSNFTNIWSMNPNSGLFYIRGQYQGSQNFRYNVNTNTYTYRADYDSAVTPKGIWYSTRNIYNFNNTSQLLYPAPYAEPSDIFDGPYSASSFSFIPETGLGIVSYNNYDYNLYEAPSSGDLLLGTLNIPNGIVVNYQDIINYYWRWNNWQERSLPSDIIKLRLLSSEEGNLSWAVYLTNDNIYNNTYYQYIWTSTQTEPYQFVSGGCYIKDSHTVIVDGVVDPYLTFSGDYSDEYNNNLELQDLKDTMQDQTDQLLDSSEVDSLLGKFGSSGDILEQFGYSPIENPFVVVIRNVFIGLNDVLLGSGNQTLDLSSFGMELVLHSDDFILPDNIIINFIHLICNGFFVYGLYKYGFQLIQWINTGRLQNLLDETTGHTHYLF